MAPSNEDELADMMATGIAYQGAAFIRYPRGEGIGIPIKELPEALEIGKSVRLKEAGKIDIWAIGSMVTDAKQLSARLSEYGIKAGVVNARFAKPLDSEALLKSAEKTPLIVTMEDHVITGGFGTAVMEALQEGNTMRPVERIGWPDAFIEHGNSVKQLRTSVGLDVESIFQRVLKRLESLSTKASEQPV